MPCQLGHDPHDQYFDDSTTIVSHTLVLEDNEWPLNAPEDLQYRVDAQTYTWRLLFADHSPEINPHCGRIGDVWVDRAAGEENIWIKTEGHSWNVWHKKVDYGAKKWNNSPVKYQHSYHPWLRERLLQFSGTTLGWFPRRLYHSHRCSWNQDKSTRGFLPTYDELDVPWIARHLSSLTPPVKSDGDVRSHTFSPTGTAVGCPRSDSPDLVMSGEPEPQLFLTQNKRKHSVPILEEEDTRKRARFQHEPRSNSPIIRDPPPHIHSSPSASAPPPPPPSALSKAFNLQQYLAALPLSLSQHADIFTALGFTQRAYFDSLALMPKPFVDEVVALLRKRGLTFMEALVFRNALNTLRRSAPAQQSVARAQPENMLKFLAGLCPPLERCATIFQDLGIELAHIPVLAQLDEESYAEFERTLKETDLTWVEIFMIRAGVKGFVEGQQEPLLIAV